MSRTELYDCHINSIFFDNVMSNINCGIGVLHVKRQILTFFDVISLLARIQRGVYRKILKIFFVSVFVI